ncbi:MAG TPA: isochorismatase family cysteine hydrolase [Methylomirabilota bacterium]|jgi:nicotinamidase-related amidase|nr:isochorismatase family cysteine hydrolase [Methylomirabilota bacterium]
MNRTALLVVDMLTDFFIPKDGLPVPVRVTSLIENTQRTCRQARERGVPVFFVNDAFQKTEVPIDRHFKLSSPHAIIGTEGALVVKELEYDEERDFLVPKKLYDGFYNTRLDSILRELDLKTCVIAGTWTNACVQHTAMGAWCRGYDVIVLNDCCSCPDEREHAHALAYMKQFYGAVVMDSDAWIAGLEGK